MRDLQTFSAGVFAAITGAAAALREWKTAVFWGFMMLIALLPVLVSRAARRKA